jgi:hypothetical protein
MKQKEYNREQPSFTYLNILCHLLKCVFFNERSLNWIFFNKYITNKILIFYLLLLLLPIKSIATGEIYFLEVGFIFESIVLSFFYYFILFILIPSKRLPVGGLIRVFFSIEIINIFMIISLYLEGNGLIVLYSIIIGWYFTLSVFVIYHFSHIVYKKAVMIVCLAFLLTNFIPFIFGS